MKWNALVAVCVVVLSSASIAQSRIDTPAAEHVTDEAAVLHASIGNPTESVSVVLYFGTRDAGEQRQGWR